MSDDDGTYVLRSSADGDRFYLQAMVIWPHGKTGWVGTRRLGDALRIRGRTWAHEFAAALRVDGYPPQIVVRLRKKVRQ